MKDSTCVQEKRGAVGGKPAQCAADPSLPREAPTCSRSASASWCAASSCSSEALALVVRLTAALPPPDFHLLASIADRAETSAFCPPVEAVADSFFDSGAAA